MANKMGSVLGDQPQDEATPQEGQGIDLEALAEKIAELLRRELEIESERAGKLLRGR